MRPAKIALAVITGAIVWAALWVSGTMLLAAAWPAHVAADRSVSDPAALLVYIAYSVVLSVLAGYVCARVAGASNRARAVAILAGLQLLLGIMIEASAWSLTPAWYHIIFLLLLVPATLYGGRLVQTKDVATPDYQPRGSW
jgi:hypothetical protein